MILWREKAFVKFSHLPHNGKRDILYKERCCLRERKVLDKRKKASLRDCIYGQAVGDALGVPYEFRRRGSFTCSGMVGHGTHNQPAGTWSDDTSMALAICDSYRELGRVDTKDIYEKFLKWYHGNAYACDRLFDFGNGSAVALNLGRGLIGEFDCGNGSLMRTVPLAFVDATDSEIRLVSAITHAHYKTTEACVYMVQAARGLIVGYSPREVAADAGIDVNKTEDQISSSGYVLDTYEAALWCLANTDNYADCVLKAVNLGDDTDTTAAVAGALAGIVYGFDAIPDSWVKKLRGKNIIEKCLF